MAIYPNVKSIWGWKDEIELLINQNMKMDLFSWLSCLCNWHNSDESQLNCALVSHTQINMTKASGA